jgi:hypothetical protein
VVRSRDLAVKIRGGEHLTIDAWVTLGALVGVHAAIVWTRVNETADGIVARAEARTLAGVLVGAAESECSRVERRWKSAEPYQLRSMASTRALSRALQGPLRHLAVMAGYQSTSAEEMPAEAPQPREETATPRDDGGPIPADIRPTDEQKAEIVALVRELELADPGVDWAARCRAIVGAPFDKTTTTQATMLIERLQAELEEDGDADAAA